VIQELLEALPLFEKDMRETQNAFPNGPPVGGQPSFAQAAIGNGMRSRSGNSACRFRLDRPFMYCASFAGDSTGGADNNRCM
jgi:hypothetical protein